MFKFNLKVVPTYSTTHEMCISTEGWAGAARTGVTWVSSCRDHKIPNIFKVGTGPASVKVVMVLVNWRQPKETMKQNDRKSPVFTMQRKLMNEEQMIIVQTDMSSLEMAEVILAQSTVGVLFGGISGNFGHVTTPFY